MTTITQTEVEPLLRQLQQLRQQIAIALTKELPVRGWLQAVAQSVTNHVWLGTSAGLLVYKPDTGQLTTVSGALGSADVRSVLAIPKDESELLWVGTTYRSSVTLDKEKG